MSHIWANSWSPDQLPLISFSILTSNDVSSLFDGKVQYSCFPNGKGGIVDDLLVYRFNAEKYLLVVNAANIEKDWNWCVKNAGKFGIRVGRDLINASDDIAQLAVQGPLALKIAEAYGFSCHRYGILYFQGN